MAPLVRRSWALSGHTPILKQRARSHQKVSVIAAIVVSPRRRRLHCYFRLHPNQNLTAHHIAAFLRVLLAQIRTPIMLVWDRLPGHRAAAITRLQQQRPRLQIELLPAYAPELNPVEYLWAYLKSNPLAHFAPADLACLSRTTRAHTRCVQRQPRLLRGFLRASPLSLRLK